MADKQEVLAPENALAITPSQQASEMLRVIKDVVSNPNVNVEAIKTLAEVQRQMIKDQAERAMNVALAAIDIPHVTKKGKIPLPDKASGQTKEVAFAKWEDIDKVIRPILRSQGLSLSFTAPRRAQDGGGADMIGYLSHVEGAVREATISLPLDTGPGRNNLQAMGSTISYGKKYLAFMLLNIVTEGEDDDGNSAELISVEQAAEIDLKIIEVKADKARFLKWIGAKDVLSIPANKYQKAITELKRKADEAKAKKGAA